MANRTFTGGGVWNGFPVTASAGTVTVANTQASPIYVVAFNDANLTDGSHWLTWCKVQPNSTNTLNLPVGWVAVKAQCSTTRTCSVTVA